MSKNPSLAMLLAGFVLLSVTQVSASDSDPPSGAKIKFISCWKCLPKRALGIVTGMVVGVPVCLVRKPIAEDKYGVAQAAGDNAKPRTKIPTAVLWAPFSLVIGTLEAPFYAVNNSLVNYKKPFSKLQFSLVDAETKNNPEETIQGTSER